MEGVEYTETQITELNKRIDAIYDEVNKLEEARTQKEREANAQKEAAELAAQRKAAAAALAE